MNSQQKLNDFVKGSKLYEQKYIKEATYKEKNSVDWLVCSCGSEFISGILLQQFLAAAALLDICVTVKASDNQFYLYLCLYQDLIK